MKCPKCGFHSYAYDNCKKCGADLSRDKGKQHRHAVPPPTAVTSKQKTQKPFVKKKVECPSAPPTLEASSQSAKNEIVEKAATSPEKVGLAARFMAKFKPDNRGKMQHDETTLGENGPTLEVKKTEHISSPERPVESPAKTKTTPKPSPPPVLKASPSPSKPAPVASPVPEKKVRRKPAPPQRSPVSQPQPQRRSAPLLEETDTFAQGLDDLPDIVSVTPSPREDRILESEQVLVEGEESGNLVQRAKEGVGRLLSRFSRESEVEEEDGFSLAEPPDHSMELSSRPDEKPVPAPLPTPAPVTAASPPSVSARKQPSRSLGKTEPEFTIDAEIEPLNASPQNVRQKPSLPAGNALPPLPTSYNSLPPSSFTTSDSLPPLLSSHGDGGLPPLPAAAVLPTIITATIEEKKPSSGDEDDDSNLDTATIDPFADDE